MSLVQGGVVYDPDQDKFVGFKWEDIGGGVGIIRLDWWDNPRYYGRGHLLRTCVTLNEGQWRVAEEFVVIEHEDNYVNHLDTVPFPVWYEICRDSDMPVRGWWNDGQN